MYFNDFSDLIAGFVGRDDKAFRKFIAGQIDYLKIKPRQYDDAFNFEGLATTPDWRGSLQYLKKNLERGQGSLDKAMAFYFLFHNTKAYFPAARNIDHYLFGSGISFQNQFRKEIAADGLGTLPSFEKVPPDPIASPSTPANSSPAALLVFKIHQSLTRPEAMEFFQKLDYSTSANAFRFNADSFRFSEDERSLDALLLNLAVVGGVLRRNELSVEDVMWLRYIAVGTLGNSQVQRYLAWIQRKDQIPGHADFSNAIHLFQRFDDGNHPVLEIYLKNARKA